MVKENKDCDNYPKTCVQNDKETKTLAKCPSKYFIKFYLKFSKI